MAVLVTGGSGYLGQFVVQSLAADHKVSDLPRRPCLPVPHHAKPKLCVSVLYMQLNPPPPPPRPGLIPLCSSAWTPA